LLDPALEEAEKTILKFGIPFCDYRKFVDTDSLKMKKIRARKRVKILKKV